MTRIRINNQRSRSAATEDDGHDHIGYETPRSGVATPKPDLHDKRLPGIMSMFAQVRPASFSQFFSFRMPTITGEATASPTPPLSTAPEHSSKDPASELNASAVRHSEESVSGTEPRNEAVPARRLLNAMTTPLAVGLHCYPTPPDSTRSSMYSSPSTSTLNISQGSQVAPPPPLPRASIGARSFSLFSRGHARSGSVLAPLPNMMSESSVAAHHISNPGGPALAMPSSSTTCASSTPGPTDAASSSSEYASVTQLKKLTNMGGFKSGTSTPARASVAAPSQTESPSNSANQETGRGSDQSATSTTSSATPAGTRVPAIKGKLTIKVSEGKGLRQCRDPYIVVSFQRSELQSDGPRVTAEVDEDAAVQAVAMGGLPIQRQGSDSGRPFMSIPMKSRQSSNTSIHDFQAFRNRPARRSFTNPKWDAEAIL